MIYHIKCIYTQTVICIGKRDEDHNLDEAL